MNGRILQEFEEKNCERLQREYLADMGIDVDEAYPDDSPDFIEDDDYWKFVEEEMSNATSD